MTYSVKDIQEMKPLTKEIAMKTVLMFVVLIGTVSAQSPNLTPKEQVVTDKGVTVNGNHSHANSRNNNSANARSHIGLAQSKANRMARSGRMAHLGGGFGKGRYEGVGMGNTRDRAIRNCCYWGRRQPIDIGAASNGRRWYACVLYK